MEASKKRKQNAQLSIQPTQKSCSNNSPFEVFPEEIWGIILLDHVNENLTLQNTFTAIPELSTVFRKHLKTLEFNQVSPQNFEYQPTLEYPKFPMELVIRSWCEAVHQFLKTEGSSPVFQHFLLTKEKNILRHCQNIYTSQEVLDFHQTLKREPNRATKFSELSFDMQVVSHEALIYLGACVDLLSEFGRTVKRATFLLNCKYVRGNNDIREFFTGFVKCLESLSNLRSLSIYLLGFTTTLENIVGQWTHFPKLSHLQELDILSSNQSQRVLLQYFLNGGYIGKGGVKTLWLTHRDYNSGSVSSSMECSLKYTLDTKLDFPKSVKEFKKFLATQEKQCAIVTPIHICQIPRLFKWLEKHDVEELTIDSDTGTTLYPVDQRLTVLRNVRYLKVMDISIMGLQFLSALPTLEYLHVELRPETKTWFLKGEMESEAFQGEPLSRLIRNYLYMEQVPNNCNIWETLPSLKMLLVADERYVFKHFIRENGNKPVVFQNTIELVELE